MIRTSSPLGSRRLRCQRCSEKKFRTTQDLALHVLSKHTKLQLPPTPADDTRSITLSSPLLSGDAEELDQLLATALRSNLVEHHDSGFEPQREQQSSAACKTRHTTPKRQRNQTAPETRKKRAKAAQTETARTATCQSPNLHTAPCWARNRVLTTKHKSASHLGEPCASAPGESIAPCTQDVFPLQCRSGHVSLAPTLLKQTTTLNFANALF